MIWLFFKISQKLGNNTSNENFFNKAAGFGPQLAEKNNPSFLNFTTFGSMEHIRATTSAASQVFK